MPDYLTAAQRNILAPNGPQSREGVAIPHSDQAPFVAAACWGWALNGEFISVNDAYSAVTIYSSNHGAFTFADSRVPTGLNEEFFAMTDLIFPQTQTYHQDLTIHFANALAGNAAAQTACRVALMKLTAALNGHEILPDNGSAVYTMVMKTSSWFGWDHWGIGVQGPSGVTTYQQKVTDTPLQYNCSVIWDEHQPLETVIRLDGLLKKQVDWLNLAV